MEWNIIYYCRWLKRADILVSRGKKYIDKKMIADQTARSPGNWPGVTSEHSRLVQAKLLNCGSENGILGSHSRSTPRLYATDNKTALPRRHWSENTSQLWLQEQCTCEGQRLTAVQQSWRKICELRHMKAEYTEQFLKPAKLLKVSATML